MIRQALIFCLVAAAVQTFKLDAPEQVAVCTLGSTLSVDGRLDTALDTCGFYEMKEYNGNKPEYNGKAPDKKAGKGGKGKNAGKGKGGKNNGGKGNGGKGNGGKGNGGKGKGGKGNGGKGKGGKGKGGKGKGNGGKKCSSFNEMMKSLGEKAEMDKCILESLGWMDANGVQNATLESVDIATLMPEIASGVQDKEECMTEKVEKFEEYLRECGQPTFTEAQIQQLVALYAMDAAGACLLNGFFEACSDLVDNVVDFVFQNDWTQVQPTELATTIIEGLSNLTGVTEQVMSGLLASFTTFLAALTASAGLPISG